MKNGKIELLRFIFASIIVLFHLQGSLNVRDSILDLGCFNLTFFNNGNMGVEFFMLVSGFLMAKSVFKTLPADGAPLRDEPADLGMETMRYLWKKVKGILPYSLFLSAVFIIVYAHVGENFSFTWVLDRIPSLFFLQRTGIGSSGFLGPTWYISAMLIAMAVLYPVCRKYYSLFTHLIAPVGGVLLTGFLIKETGGLGNGAAWLGFTFKCNLRALAEISVGASCFEISRYLSAKEFSFAFRALLTGVEFFSYAAVFIYICSDLAGVYQGSIMLLLAVGITLSFSQKTLLAKSALFQNRFFYFLGAVSLPVYLAQNIIRFSFPVIFEGFDNFLLVPLCFGATILTGCVCYLIWTALSRRLQTGAKSRPGAAGSERR